MFTIFYVWKYIWKIIEKTKKIGALVIILEKF
jgi:hypothetical protein